MLADNATLNSGGHIFYDLAPLPVLDPIYLQTSHLLHHTSYFILQTHTSDVIFKTTYFRRHISDVIFQTSYYRRHTAQQTSLNLEGGLLIQYQQYTTLDTITQTPLLIGINGVVMWPSCSNNILGYVIMSHR